MTPSAIVTDVTENSINEPLIESNTAVATNANATIKKPTREMTEPERKEAQVDWDTDEPITVKNIIITFCDNYTLSDAENKGRQGLKNIGTFDGYYITNGKAIKIKCIKNARDEKTVYQDLNGNEIDVNDGNTFVHICPSDADVEIVAPLTPETTNNTSSIE